MTGQERADLAREIDRAEDALLRLARFSERSRDPLPAALAPGALRDQAFVLHDALAGLGARP